MNVKKIFLNIAKGTVYLILIGWAIIALMPLYWMFTTALQLPDEVFSMPPRFIPTVVKKFFPLLLEGKREEAIFLLTESLRSIRVLFTDIGLPRWFLNSVIVSVTATLGILVFDSMAGYVFAKKQFPGRDFLFWLMISTMMIPGQVTLVPMFILIGKLGLKNSLGAVIFPPLAMVFGVFLMRQFMKTIPSELIEAAKIDGASEFSIYWRVILPLSKPALATLGILTFMAVWNSFLWPLIVLNKDYLYTLPVGLKTLQDKNLVDYGLLMSGASIAAIPMIIVFLFFQKYFVKGLTLGSLKG
ncbi:MAG: multiple sugar transport system permease protein [Halanaerobiales bacterium]|nr:multiple sugar transport system permease protein [Halanaerobiales bacterium]